MRPTGSYSLIVKGVIHCHTDLSYDSEVNLADLCTVLRHEGFDFVALTEHSEGVNANDYKNFVKDCQRESNDTFIAIPGLEIRCSNGIEIAGIGIPELVSAGTASSIVDQVRHLGGYAVWVHPFKKGQWESPLPDCDAIEVLNGKIDGTIAPKLSLIRAVRKCRQERDHIHAIFGLDLHDLQESLNVWTECEVSSLTSFAIVESLREGRFVNRLANGTVDSSGDLMLLDFLRLMLLRLFYSIWNAFLKILPDIPRKWVIQLSRPVIKIIK